MSDLTNNGSNTSTNFKIDTFRAVSYPPDTEIKVALINQDHAVFFVEDDGGQHRIEDIEFQSGIVSENGINGVTNENVIEALILRIRALNDVLPCRENSLAITKLDEALHWLEARTKDRVKRGVEDSYNP